MGVSGINSPLEIGDFVPRAGIYTQPGVVTEMKENGEVLVDTNPISIAKYHRHAITTGLTPEDKDKFNKIMDDVMTMKTNDERMNSLQKTIDTLKEDPSNRKVANALHNQQAILIRKSQELPKVYQVSADKIKQ
jgi:hypothetical protein